ncbi:hypothetical protein V7798_02885 [Rhizobium laguerreae]
MGLAAPFLFFPTRDWAAFIGEGFREGKCLADHSSVLPAKQA